MEASEPDKEEEGCGKENSFGTVADAATARGRSVECCICLEPVTRATKAILNPCVHSDFHEACITSWVQQKKTCPLCDKEIDSMIYEIGAQGRGYKTKRITKRQDTQSDQEFAHQLFYNDLLFPNFI